MYKISIHVDVLTTVHIIPYIYADDVKYYEPSIYRLPGEWIDINCDLLPRGTSSLSVVRKSKTHFTIESYDLSVDNKKIFWVSKNVYNITRLTYNDSAQYECQTSERLNMRTELTLFKDQNLIVLKKGKTRLPGVHIICI